MPTLSHLSSTRLFCLILAAGAASACSAPGDDGSIETAESDVLSRVSGGSIASPNADPQATYLSVRNIDVLREVGALSGSELSLALRVDGILANKPADGRMSIDELLRIESPGIVQTLFPEEKAALPAMWKLLETTADAPKNAVMPPALSVTPTDLTTPAGTLVGATVLPIADLPGQYQQIARRVELTNDADGDPSTIARADAVAALGFQDPYTATEVGLIDGIVRFFDASRETSFAPRIDLPMPFEKVRTVTTFGGARILAKDTLVVEESRKLETSSASPKQVNTSLRAKASRTLVLDAAADTRVVVLNEGTEEEAVLDPARLDRVASGVLTLETWVAGAKTSITRVKVSNDVQPDEQSVDLSDYADYPLTVDGAPTFKNFASFAQDVNHQPFWASMTYRFEATAKPMPSGYVETHRSLATSAALLPGRYELTTPAALRIDVAATGVVIGTLDGETKRAVFAKTSDGAKQEFWLYFQRGLVRIDVRTRTVHVGGASAVLDPTKRTG